ncbi:hypothetical protein Y030_6046 [Burkholderia pseudomallei MSHR332]|nr:hypothetical protein Y030_6046 [Burkholderia pseudomallei MSHR332]
MPRNHDQMGRHRNGGNGAAFGGAVGPVRPWMDARASLRQHSRPLRRLARYGGIPIVAYCRVHGACRCVVRADVYRHVPVSGERPSRPASEIV